MTTAMAQGSTGVRRGWSAPAAVIVFVVIAHAVLDLPGHPDAVTSMAFLPLPLEIPLAALVLLLAPKPVTRLLCVVFSLCIAVILLLKIADIGTQAAFQRVFNPYLDLKMLRDGWDLLARSAGRPLILVAALALLLALALLIGGFYKAARHLARLAESRRRKAVAFFSLLAIIEVGLSLLPAALPVEAKAGPYLLRRVELIVTSFADMRRFESELAAATGTSGPADFAAVAGRDVVVIFVESYGRSAIEDPRYAPVSGPRLSAMQRKIDGAGLSAASGWLTSPTVGGLSWLAHATTLSGLWIDSQARYDRLMQSRVPSLNRRFAQAGWQSLAVMPAVTLDWPDARWYGYERILAAADLGYRGKPFNWITMPDQYTLSAFERLARAPARVGGRPVMAEIALISSHAPWTPVPEPVAWEAIGDGTIFAAQATSGEAPAVVWADPDNVRRHYIKTIDYTLEILSEYLARSAGDGLFIILGDHQPAAIVTGPQASRAVPVHIVSRDAALVQRFRLAGFSAGLRPGPEAAERPMSGFAPLLLSLLAQTR